MAHLARRLKVPSHHDPRPLQQMARDLDMPHVGWVVLRVDIVVLEDPPRLEVAHIRMFLELVVDALRLVVV